MSIDFWNPDTPPAPAYYAEWLRLASQAARLVYLVAEKSLRHVHGVGVLAGSTSDLVAPVGVIW